ncbi:hypothetical protein NEUTE1DRAFT_126149 [Neurospora tetrasperma FGSC 2508]|uniref:Acetylserotonin methytransferase-like protein n=1 Tax=Neurospora tetrasperma (strain FGSC 2508 / ATCC MYA-4615 / P0657) TaxID=510951 RepID=F8N4E5_NEUT8|nr:uncharacterized protein NEUTE1DRAFT_126149 [Neurospora tetrasperma FGSC 2508]EGO52686.1 hypothetical protein NEUTE1DRAFT_126149 [Neurospora tetrasperma FGSC 2508]
MSTATTTTQAGGGFSLFPNTNVTPRPPSRPSRAATPQGRPSTSTEPSSSREAGRQSPIGRVILREGKQRSASNSNNPWQSALDSARQQREHREQPQEQPQRPPLPENMSSDPIVETSVAAPISEADAPPRCETTLSEAETLVGQQSRGAQSSFANPPIAYTPGPSNTATVATPTSIPEPPQPPQPAAIRSIFPRYNPELPLDRQDYYPTQASPTHIPQSAISRPMYSARDTDQQSEVGPNAGTNGPSHTRNRPVANPSVTSGSANQRWPVTRSHEPPVLPTVNTTEELRGLWKAANGWRATQLEGRKYCLKMASDAYAPVYTLSSSSNQPFYCLRVDPTSASALVSLSRYDPNKTFKGDKSTSAAVGISAASAVASSASSSTSSASSSPIPSARASSSTPSPRPSSVFSRNPDGSGGALGGASISKSTKTKKHDAKHWQEVISTTLEAATRKQPPNDGLVAQLWPLTAARLVSDRATTDAATVAAAENECGRLVWDSDSGNHYLVHAALAMPFCITVERNAAYSRTEYTLEHIESPNHLGRLTRDGTGQGWLEIDTAIASHVEAVYLIDVAIAALVLVAHADEQFTRVETFEPPPSLLRGAGGGGAGVGGSQRSSLAESLSSVLRRNTSDEKKNGNKDDKKKRKKREKDLVKGIKTRVEQFELDIEAQVNADMKAKNEKMPGCTRGLIAVLKFAFKAIIWCATLVFKVFMLLIKGCGKGAR